MIDLFNIQMEEKKFICLATPNLIGIPEMPYILKGETILLLCYYQENGQTGDIKLKVEWNGIEDFQNLPTITIIYPLGGDVRE